jgi:hypothetical protein
MSSDPRTILNGDMKRVYPAPPNATGFFIGHSSGGSDWQLVKSDGSIEKYYIDLTFDYLPSAGRETGH